VNISRRMVTDEHGSFLLEALSPLIRIVDPYLSASIRIYPYLSVSIRIYPYLSVSIRVSPWLNLSSLGLPRSHGGWLNGA